MSAIALGLRPCLLTSGPKPARANRPPRYSPNQRGHGDPGPAGAARWTLALLTERVVELRYVDSISDETVRKVLKKANSSPG